MSFRSLRQNTFSCATHSGKLIPFHSHQLAFNSLGDKDQNNNCVVYTEKYRLAIVQCLILKSFTYVYFDGNKNNLPLKQMCVLRSSNSFFQADMSLYLMVFIFLQTFMGDMLLYFIYNVKQTQSLLQESKN